MQAAIAWCKDNIADASFSMNGENPPLRFEDKSMDLIYACSVFTHLDAEDQFRWLAELQRIMKPDGYLLLTFRYRHNIDQLADLTMRDRIWEGPRPRRHRLPAGRPVERRCCELGRRDVSHARNISGRTGAGISRCATSSRQARSNRKPPSCGPASRPSCSGCFERREGAHQRGALAPACNMVKPAAVEITPFGPRLYA